METKFIIYNISENKFVCREKPLILVINSGNAKKFEFAEAKKFLAHRKKDAWKVYTNEQ